MQQNSSPNDTDDEYDLMTLSEENLPSGGPKVTCHDKRISSVSDQETGASADEKSDASDNDGVTNTVIDSKPVFNETTECIVGAREDQCGAAAATDTEAFTIETDVKDTLKFPVVHCNYESK
jgi:hypothetical protein